jgi:hypothetical protein
LYQHGCGLFKVLSQYFARLNEGGKKGKSIHLR